MFNFKKRRLAEKLASVGAHVDTTFLVYINNDEPISFLSRQSALQHIEEYRLTNQIFKLQIYRIESYSL